VCVRHGRLVAACLATFLVVLCAATQLHAQALSEDMSLAKKFFFGERVNAELTMEFYDVLNRMMPGHCGSIRARLPGFPIYSFGYDRVGVICQNNSPRTGQAFMKITF